MKFLIAGLGSIGRRHLRNLLALGQRDILLYRTGKSTLPDAELANFPVETNLQTALDHNPQAVIVANPTALHLQVALPAAEKGCHLLLEKPISHNMEGIPKLRAAVQASGSQVLTGFQFRFHPGLQKIKALLAENAIGKPLSLRAHWGEYLPGWHPWEDHRQSYSARPDLGGGVVLTLSHPLDYLRFLFGEVETLWAMTSQSSILGIEAEDTAEIGLRFASGVLGSLHLDYLQRPPKHYLEIIGAEGTLRWDNSDGTAHLFRAGASAWESFPPSPSFERNSLFLAEMSHFLEMISRSIPPLCSLEDGIRALELALAAHISAREMKPIYPKQESQS